MIRILNPKIRGWTNYFRHMVSKDIFSRIDHEIFWATWRWAKRRHPNKNKQWIWNKYFQVQGVKKGTLSALAPNHRGKNQIISLVKASSTQIRRHIKIRAEANPYDPAFDEYFAKRNRKIKPEDDDFLSILNIGKIIDVEAFRCPKLWDCAPFRLICFFLSWKIFGRLCTILLRVLIVLWIEWLR